MKQRVLFNLQNLRAYMKSNPKKTMRVAVILLLVIAAFALRMSKADENALVVEADAGTETTEFTDVIYVDISGEVNNPGIYKLDGETRLYQLIDKAGGLTEDADINLINQAECVEDGQKIIIPKVSKDKERTSEEESDGLVNINTASASELSTLPGIGDAIAKRIIDYRSENRFKSKEDLKNVNGIGDKTYAKLESMISI